MLTEAKLLIPGLLSSNPNSDGTFTVLAPTEDGIKRHKVTAPDTTLVTLDRRRRRRRGQSQGEGQAPSLRLLESISS